MARILTVIQFIKRGEQEEDKEIVLPAFSKWKGRLPKVNKAYSIKTNKVQT